MLLHFEINMLHNTMTLTYRLEAIQVVEPVAHETFNINPVIVILTYSAALADH